MNSLPPSAIISISLVFFVTSLIMLFVFFGSKKVRKVFDNLVFEGFMNINSTDEELVNTSQNVLVDKTFGLAIEIKNAIKGKDKGQNFFYLCDFWYTVHDGRKTGNAMFSAVIYPKHTSNTNHLIIRRKMPDILEEVFGSGTPGKIVTAGLEKDFINNFRAYSLHSQDSQNDNLISSRMQTALVNHKDLFPFRQRKDSETTIHITEHGWALVCQRVMQESVFRELIQVAEEIHCHI